MPEGFPGLTNPYIYNINGYIKNQPPKPETPWVQSAAVFGEEPVTNYTISEGAAKPHYGIPVTPIKYAAYDEAAMFAQIKRAEVAVPKKAFQVLL